LEHYEWRVCEHYRWRFSPEYAQNAQQIKASYAALISKCQEQLRDRIDNGDEIYVSGGKDAPAVPVRRKMAGKDLAITAAVCTDKAILLDKISGGSDEGEGRVESLLQRLECLAQHQLDAAQTVARQTAHV